MGVIITLKVVISVDTVRQAIVVQLGNYKWIMVIKGINMSGWVILLSV
jgi:hypothetical protein